MEDQENEEDLYRLWMQFTARGDEALLYKYIASFVKHYSHLVDLELKHLDEISAEEGPHLTQLPDGLLQSLSKVLLQCSEQCNEDMTEELLNTAQNVVKCLIIICRNFDNIYLVASCAYIQYILNICGTCLKKADFSDMYKGFLEHTLYFLECLYDPYFIWRKRLKSSKVDKSGQLYQPVLLHVEVVPFMYDFFHICDIPVCLQQCFLHVFGAIMTGSQHNALKVISPATMDILLKVLSGQSEQSNTNQTNNEQNRVIESLSEEESKEFLALKEVAVKCIVRMVQVIHCASPDQRQIEVSAILEGLLQVLHVHIDDKFNTQVQLAIINSLPVMLTCRDKPALQVTMVSVGVFSHLVNYLNNAELGAEWTQLVARAAVNVLSSIMTSCSVARASFQENIGYGVLGEALRKLGPPSQELLKNLLNLAVEQTFTPGVYQVIKNVQVIIMLVQWLPEMQPPDLQGWLAQQLQGICTCGVHNLTQCCSAGLITAVLEVFQKEENLHKNAVGFLIGLLEHLGSHSITAAELKLLISLFREKRCVEHISLMHAMSVMARREGKQRALHYFDLQHQDSGISLPGIRKWPGSCFSFHAWFCLTAIEDRGSNNLHCRYQLYSFLSTAGSGFEAFFTNNGVLVVAIATKKEYLTVDVTDSPIKDTEWHSLAIVHSNAKRPFSQSQITIYIDGHVKLESQLKFPPLTEPFTSCRIGSRGLHTFVVEQPHEDTKPKSSGFRLPFTIPKRSSVTSAQSITAGSQDTEWGIPTSLHGLLGSVCVYHDVVDANQIRKMNTLGPNALITFHKNEDPELADMSGKLLLSYNAKACQDSLCLDLSPHQNNGRLTGHHCASWDIKEVINCIGGIQVLFPLLEQAESIQVEGESDHDFCANDLDPQSETDGEWVVLRSSSYADSKLEKNPVASFLILVRNMIHLNPRNQDNLIQNQSIATIGALLQKVPSEMMDVRVLMAVQLLVETVAISNTALLHNIYQFLLFDFRVWSRCQFHVKIGHIQYLSTIIKDERKYFRKKYGVHYMLNIIRTYYSATSGHDLSDEDSHNIRVSLLGLVRYYVSKEINSKELDHILKFLVTVQDNPLLCEALDLLISLLESPFSSSQLYLLLFEHQKAELLYVLLTKKDYTTDTKEKVLKIFSILLKSDKVYEKYKSHLQLTDIGYSGIVGLMQGSPLTKRMVRCLLEQAAYSDSTPGYNALLSVLPLLKAGDIDMKITASKQLLRVLLNRSGAAKKFAQQVGWQAAIASLLVLHASVAQSSSGDDLIHDNNLQSEVSYATDSGVTSGDGKEADDTLRADDTDIHFDIEEGDSKYESILRKKPIPHLKVQTPGVDSVFDLNFSPVGSPQFSKLNSSFSSYLDGSDSEATPRTSRAISEISTEFDEFNFNRQSTSSLGSLSLSSTNPSIQPSDSASQADESGAANPDIDFSQSDTLTQQELRMSQSDAMLHAAILDTSNSTVNDANEDTELNEKLSESVKVYNMSVRSPSSKEDELCQNVLLILFTIIWKGVENSNIDSWKARYQVFSAFKNLGKSNELVLPPRVLERRLLEMMLTANRADLLQAAQLNAAHTENAAHLIKLVHHFLMQESPDRAMGYTEMIIENLMSLLDVLNIWDDASQWPDMVNIGLSVLLEFAADENVNFCAIAAAKLHTIVHSRNIESEDEAMYLLTCVNEILDHSVKENKENYSFLLPVLKALLDKCSQMLHISAIAPNLPESSRPSFFDDFKVYSQALEWTGLVKLQMFPGKMRFVANNFAELKKTITSFTGECHEAMMIGIHKRNREKGESKMAFEREIQDPFLKRRHHEDKNYQNMMTQQMNQQLSVLRQWRSTKRFFTGERGAWAEKETPPLFWKLSSHENFLRMRPKLIQNYGFDAHTEASRLRDNLGTELKEDTTEEEAAITLLKEAKVSQDKIGDDRLGDEEWNIVSSAGSHTEEQTTKEKLVLSEKCEVITLGNSVPGKLELTSTHVYFFDCSSNKEGGGEDFKWPLSLLREIHFRRYNLRRSALELFLVDQTNYFLNFEKRVRNKVYTHILSLRPPNLIYYGSRSPAELLKASGLTQKWVNREISNFEYLMQLNTIAGRTYNDLSQYPVFPWILQDYRSETLDLNNPDVYRDLSKPVGILNPKHEKEVRDKFDTFEDPSGVIEKFHYGTHYSSAAAVMHYLLRLEPFTTLHIELQSGRFDVADRQFHSIAQTWDALLGNPNDVKELVPEFFYLPEFLQNLNDFDLGKLQLSKQRVHEVSLPAWASSPEDFIHKHREALESDFVSARLHNWIDLIFGYKQKGPEAVEAANVFYYCTYEGAVDLDAISDPAERKAVEGMINHFGQTPCQLLKEPHPPRLTFEAAVNNAGRLDKHLNVLQFLNQLKAFFVEVTSESDPVVYVSVPRSQARSFIQHGMPDNMITVNESGVLGVHGWLPYDKSISNYFTFDKDPTFSSTKTQRSLAGPFSPDTKVTSKLFVVSHDAKLVFSGGHWDNSLRVFSLAKNKKVAHITRHADVITCLALDYCGRHVMTGSRDTTCMIWEVTYQSGVSSNLSPNPFQVLYGHDAEVTCIAISVELDMAVSGSKDGTIIIHTIRKGVYMHTIKPSSDIPGVVPEIQLLAVSDVGQIAAYSTWQVPNKQQHKHYLHLYSVNAMHLTTEQQPHRLTQLRIVGDHLLMGNEQGLFVVKALFGLKTLTSMPLHVPIQCLSVTNSNSHVLVALKDGKLIIIGIKKVSEVKTKMLYNSKTIKNVKEALMEM